MPTNLTALRARLVAMLEAEGRVDLDPLKSTHITSAGYTHLANLTERINDPASAPHYRGRPVAMTYREWSDCLAATRNSFRPLLTLALGLIDGCESCWRCSGSGNDFGPRSVSRTSSCRACTPSRALLKRLAEEIGE